MPIRGTLGEEWDGEIRHHWTKHEAHTAGEIFAAYGIFNITDFAEFVRMHPETLKNWCHKRPNMIFLMLEGFQALGLHERVNSKTNQHFYDEYWQ